MRNLRAIFFLILSPCGRGGKRRSLECVCLAGFGLEIHRLIARAQAARVAELGTEDELRQLPAVPGHVDLVPAAGAQAGDGTARPRLRQRGEQIDLEEVLLVRRADVALQEHLRDAAGRAEVAVDLERAAQVE